MTNSSSRQLDRSTTAPDYLCIDDLLMLIDEPNRRVCQRILADHRPLFERARGSTHNHQTWDGGYIDHVTDGMNYARHLYAMTESLGRPLPFSLSDALLVFYLHDLEKPWRILVRADGQAVNCSGLDTKAAFKAFREAKLDEYGLKLTPAQRNGLTYVEGEMQDYSSRRRVMNELAAFCHMVDVWSARIGYDYPKHQDEWVGAGRFRTSERHPRAKNLTFVSLTGPDDEVSIDELVKLNNEFTGVEWALLYVPGKEGAPRNPTQAWRKEFFAALGSDSSHSTAVHLCGKVAFQQLMETSLPIELLEANRFQLNVNARGTDFTEDETVQIFDNALRYGQELILQYHDGTMAAIRRFLRQVPYHYRHRISVLLDGSKGRGVSPESWAVPQGLGKYRCGFAGGIGPHNVVEVLGQVEVFHQRPYWVDMETKLRTDNQFDLRKARAVLEAVRAARS